MGEIRAGRDEVAQEFPEWAKRQWECLFCGDRVGRGAQWRGATDVAVCSWCVLDGELGKLIGDALDTQREIEQALIATERHACRSRLLAAERRERKAE